MLDLLVALAKAAAEDKLTAELYKFNQLSVLQSRCLTPGVRTYIQIISRSHECAHMHHSAVWFRR
jgi:hypothetical protein